MTALTAGDLTLNQVLTRLGYKVVRHREKTNGTRPRSIRKDGKAIRFERDTIKGRYKEVTHLERNATASLVWRWLRDTDQIV